MTVPEPPPDPTVLVLAPEQANAARALRGVAPDSWRYVSAPEDVVDMDHGQPYLLVDLAGLVLNATRSKTLRIMQERGVRVGLLDVPLAPLVSP